jgi:hypothetical protein
MIAGRVIGGDFSRILARQKSDYAMELGELLVAEKDGEKILLQVFDLVYGSQMSQQNLELISGFQLEEDSEIEVMDTKLRNYNIAALKTLVGIKGNKASMCKNLPAFFSELRQVTNDDLAFITKPKNPIFIGKLRSGSKALDVDVFLDGSKVFAHHILIPATTGKGKSNLTKCLLWDSVDKEYCGILVLDPHDEYYGRTELGLKDHPMKDKIVYYTPRSAPSGQRTLKINLNLLRPSHFAGSLAFTDAQGDAINAYYRKYGDTWIEALLLEQQIDVQVQDYTKAVVKRKLINLLDLSVNNKVYCNGIFDSTAGQTTLVDIAAELEKGNIVILDTSSFSGNLEILIGSMIALEILDRYKASKMKGSLEEKPVISIVIEEAPRVLGKDVLDAGPNVFSMIAREGRKFKIGLTAITQLPSLIPRDILANMNTKIVLGIEMAPERQAIIESASQDLSNDGRTIASLDIGEALITSNFAKFAIPVKIPFFDDFVKGYQNKFNADKYSKSFSGIKKG